MLNPFERECYIGVTGYMAAREVEATLATTLSNGRRLMVGVLMSSTKLSGGTPHYPGRYPEPDAIKDIFIMHPNAINLIHYAGNDKAQLPERISKLIDLGGEYLDGFQFNMIWPNPQHLRAAADRLKRIVLQLNGPAIRKAKNSPELVADKLRAYEGCVSDVLLDLSGGNGKMIDVEYARRFLDYLVPKLPRFVFGVAGGLCPETIDQIAPLLNEFPSLNIDAESRLRSGADELVVERANEYLRAAAKMIARHARH